MNSQAHSSILAEVNGYESLIADMLTTKSMLFSVVGLGPAGVRWVNRLTAYGFATVAIDPLKGSTPAFSDHGMIRLSDEVEEVRCSDVIIYASGVPSVAEIRRLARSLKRGQTLCFSCEQSPGEAQEQGLREEIGRVGRQLGGDLFAVYLPEPFEPGPSTRQAISGMTEACARVGRGLYDEILSQLVDPVSVAS